MKIIVFQFFDLQSKNFLMFVASLILVFASTDFIKIFNMNN